MQTLHFEKEINAPKEKVWHTLWDDKTYREWTGVFSEGSYAVSDWKQGSKIHFLSPKGEGMYSVIEKLDENKFMSFRHIGVLKEGKEQPLDEDTKQWSGSKENYTLKENNGKTILIVELDIVDSFADYFSKAFPNAIQKVKEIAEK